MDDTLEYVMLLGFAAVLMLYFVHVKMDNLSRRLKNIEDVLGVETDLKRALKIDPDVEARIKGGKINQAIKLHRSRHNITAKEAETIIKQHAAIMT
ncbi:MAG: hypothetical protein V4484_16680 [Pseudomonadota bacterium]